MKKIIVLVLLLIVSFTPSLVSAVWWNPSTWFEKKEIIQEEKSPSSEVNIQGLLAELSKKDKEISDLKMEIAYLGNKPPVIKEVQVKVPSQPTTKTVTNTVTVPVNNPELLKQIEALKTESNNWRLSFEGKLEAEKKFQKQSIEFQDRIEALRKENATLRSDYQNLVATQPLDVQGITKQVNKERDEKELAFFKELVIESGKFQLCPVQDGFFNETRYPNFLPTFKQACMEELTRSLNAG